MPAPPPDARPRPTILIPVFNDWNAAIELLEQLDVALAGSSRTADVLFVDDASTDPLPETVRQRTRNALIDLRVLKLRSNLGHQRAIAVGLAHLYSTSAVSTVVVMDGDGEDKAEDVPRLLDRFEREAGRKLIFALRLRRSEGFAFTFFYHFYRLLHWLLTGIPVRFGNFSVVPRDAMTRLVVSADLWNHYAASVLRSRVPFDVLPTERGERIAGRSKMNFVAQVSHGLSALSVFGELIGVRLLIGCFVLCVLFLLGSVSVLSLGHELNLPGWAAMTAVVLLVLLVQTLIGSVAASLLVLHSRGRSTFLPIRDYPYFIEGVEVLDHR